MCGGKDWGRGDNVPLLGWIQRKAVVGCRDRPSGCSSQERQARLSADQGEAFYQLRSNFLAMATFVRGASRRELLLGERRLG